MASYCVSDGRRLVIDTPMNVLGTSTKHVCRPLVQQLIQLIKRETSKFSVMRNICLTHRFSKKKLQSDIYYSTSIPVYKSKYVV